MAQRLLALGELLFETCAAPTQPLQLLPLRACSLGCKQGSSGLRPSDRVAAAAQGFRYNMATTWLQQITYLGQILRRRQQDPLLTLGIRWCPRD